MAPQTDRDRLHDLVEKQRFVMLTTADEEGTLVSRPMTVQEVDGWVLRFITQGDTRVTREAEGRHVNLASNNGGTYLSLSGTGSVTRDLALKKELWNRLNEAYAGDAEDPNNVVLEVQVDSGEYWESGNPVVEVIGLAKTLITGTPQNSEHGSASV